MSVVVNVLAVIGAATITATIICVACLYAASRGGHK